MVGKSKYYQQNRMFDKSQLLTKIRFSQFDYNFNHYRINLGKLFSSRNRDQNIITLM